MEAIDSRETYNPDFHDFQYFHQVFESCLNSPLARIRSLEHALSLALSRSNRAAPFDVVDSRACFHYPNDRTDPLAILDYLCNPSSSFFHLTVCLLRRGFLGIAQKTGEGTFIGRAVISSSEQLIKCLSGTFVLLDIMLLLIMFVL